MTDRRLTRTLGLPHPALGVLIIAKHLSYAGREEFTFAQVEEEYLRFSRTKLVGSGKVRWSMGVLRMVSARAASLRHVQRQVKIHLSVSACLCLGVASPSYRVNDSAETVVVDRHSTTWSAWPC